MFINISRNWKVKSNKKIALIKEQFFLRFLDKIVMKMTYICNKFIFLVYP